MLARSDKLAGSCRAIPYTTSRAFKGWKEKDYVDNGL